MGKKIAVGMVSVIIVLGGAGFYATPYFAFRNMRIAAENKDTETLNNYVDYKLLKESLKANLNDKISREAGSNKDEGAMDTLAHNAIDSVGLENRFFVRCCPPVNG